MKVKIPKYNRKAGKFPEHMIKFHGSDFWSLDHTLAKIIAPALGEFRKHHIMGTPPDMTMREFKTIIRKMERAFTLINELDSKLGTAEEQAEVREGLDLFAKWYQALWN